MVTHTQQEMELKRNNGLFIIAILFALWFAIAGMVWVYWFNIILAYPFGLVAFFIWRHIRKDGKERNKVIPIILIIGLLASLGALALIR